MSLTLNTPIPTAARGAVRAFVKAHPAFEAWIAATGTESRKATNGQLLDFALQHGIADMVEILIHNASMAPAPVVVAAPIAPIAPAPAPAPAPVSQSIADMVAEHEEAESMPAMVSPEPEPEPVKPETSNDLLAGVDQFLSPFVRAEIEKVLAPLIERANKPAVVKEVVRTVTVEGPASLAPLPAGSIPYATTNGQTELGRLFGAPRSSIKNLVTLWDSAGQSPAVDPMYVVDLPNMAMLATALESGTNVWLFGPAGSGKTTMPIQFAARTGRPAVKINFDKHTEVGSLVGNPGLKAGATVWEDGTLIAAMRRPGTVIVLDEPTLASPGVQGIIQAVTDEHRSYTIHATGEVVRAAPGVVFVACDNTNGSGDETGQYAGTHQANAALVNRFGRMLSIDFMSKADEAKALANHTKAPPAACVHLVDFMTRARKLPDLDGVVLSIRQEKALIRTVQDGFSAKQALAVTILNKLPKPERAAIETLANLQWATEFEALVRSTGPDAAGQPVQGSGPSNSPAAVAFDDAVSASLART